MQHKIFFLIFFLLTLSAALKLHAQEAPLEGFLPDSIVVTASRNAEDVRITGRRMTVLTARDLAAAPVASVDELLRTVGGVETLSRGGFGVQSDITMRGSTFNGVLVLVDGARLNDPMTGHFLSDLPVPLSEIVRVEIMRGPATVLYGPDAIGGVIQIFTYAGLADAAQAAPGLEGSALLQRGEHELYNLDAHARLKTGRTLFSAATNWQGSDGMEITGADGRTLRSSRGEVRTDFSRQSHALALTHAFNNASFYARVGVDDRDFGAFHFYTPFPSDTAREATTTYWTQLRLQGNQTAPTRWQVQAAARQHEDEYIYNPRTPANRHTSRLFYGQAQAARDLHRNLLATGGGTVSLRGIESNNLGQHQDASAGAFLSGRWQPASRLTLNAGGRLDYDPGYGAEATPQFSVAYNLKALTLRAGASRAVRAPNYVERYFNTTVRSPRGGNLGNPDLKAERAWAYEAGLDVYPLPGLSFHATGFLRDTDNLIDFARLSAQDTVFLARNILSVRTRGLEIDAEARQTLGMGRVRFAASYAWLDAELGDAPAGATFKYVLTNARHLVQGLAAFDAGPASLGLQALWKEPLQGDSYGLVNARLGYRFSLRRGSITLSGELRNLFDVQYTEVFDAPMPGRWWLFGLRLSR